MRTRLIVVMAEHDDDAAGEAEFAKLMADVETAARKHVGGPVHKVRVVEP